MRFSFYLTAIFLIINVANANAIAPTRVQVDGTWYTDGQFAYLECGKSSVHVEIDFVADEHDVRAIKVVPTANFSVSATTSDVEKILNLDPNKNGGYIDVSFVNDSGSIRIYIVQRPPVPNFTASSFLCTPGSEATFSVSDSYTFQGTKPMNLVWQTTGGVTVNGGTTYTTSGSTISSVTLHYTSSGSVSVKAVIPNCSNLESGSVTYYLGPPIIAPGQLTLFYAGTNTWQFTQINQSGASSFSFYVATGSATLVPNFTDCYITTSTGANVCVTATNSCGTGSPYCFYVPAGGSMLKAAYPNPASNQLTIQFNNADSENSLPSNISLFSESSTEAVRSLSVKDVFEQKTFEDGDKVIMDVSNLPRGNYFLHVVPNDGSKQPAQRLRIKLE